VEAGDLVVGAADRLDVAVLVDGAGDREPAVGGQDGRDALEIICAVYESARTGRTVSLGS